jgi:hypothetical protein
MRKNGYTARSAIRSSDERMIMVAGCGTASRSSSVLKVALLCTCSKAAKSARLLENLFARTQAFPVSEKALPRGPAASWYWCALVTSAILFVFDHVLN